LNVVDGYSMNLIMIHELEVPLNHGIFILDDVKGCIRGMETNVVEGYLLRGGQLLD